MFTAEIRPVPNKRLLDARRWRRAAVVVPGRINDVGARSLCRVADLSITGARLLTVAPLTPGAAVLVTLPGQEPRAATIMWSDGHAAGCKFAEPLSQRLLDLLVAMYRFTPADPDSLINPN